MIAFSAAAFAKEPKAYQSGKLLQMDSVSCGVDEKDAKSFTGELIGTDSGHKKDAVGTISVPDEAGSISD